MCNKLILILRSKNLIKKQTIIGEVWVVYQFKTILLFMKGISTFLFFVFCAAGTFTTQSVKAQNLALHKPYTLSVKPNYKLSAPSTDKSSLTDGIYTDGYFWTQNTTVGWQDKKSVQISIDLEEIKPMGTITFSTAGGKADVHFPKNIYTFISKDGKTCWRCSGCFQ